MNSEEILEEINERGIFIFDEPFLDTKKIKEIRYLASTEFLKNLNSDYKFGRSARIGNYEGWQNTAVHELFSKKLIWDIANKFYGEDPKFNEIFLTHDYINTEGLARNGWLHYDRIPTLKFFMYLTDCDSRSGAFRYVPGSYEVGKRLRETSILESNNYENIKNRLEVDYPDLGYTKHDTAAVEGPAGTMFIFHSDLFHCGGLVEDGFSREIIRMHVRK